jgi:hypothetical protein
MEEQINTFLKNINKNHNYINKDDKSTQKIYELLINNIIYEPENVDEIHYLG